MKETLKSKSDDKRWQIDFWARGTHGKEGFLGRIEGILTETVWMWHSQNKFPLQPKQELTNSGKSLSLCQKSLI